ncbi:type IV-A pilus assembly ATPase PilB [Thioalbus denitrificans]|uniref:Type IV pilus assembly protein PilB n=1 Tax=Thioalbus denitrificans TaxID=547122 RepID=A0A369CIR4_9GAMM|nr:type IV-A pilus assembly ATPase PilB [Thioalbus denitrificans]RCX33451.1 type IV pilus assembly protein PilB [Thioalbus denitrificans]
MATQSTPVRLSGLARRLVIDGLLTETDAQAAFDQSLKEKIPLVTYLVQNGLVEDGRIAVAASEEFGAPVLDIDSLDIGLLPKDLVSEKLIRKHRAIPLFKRGSRLYVGLADPTNLQALDEIKFHTGINTDAVVVEESKLSRFIDRVVEAQEATNLGDLSDSDLDGLDISGGDELPQDEVRDTDVDDAPIVRFVNKVMLDAINKGASDIHFEPYERNYRVRFRQDGILHEMASPPVTLGSRIAARLKVMSRLDISERRIPQDGRIKMTLSKNRAIDFRVSTCPTLYGEKVVMRILDPASARLGVDALGFEEAQKDLFQRVIHKPQGMVLVTGPTGSGKTVTLYTALSILNTPDKNISTVEDPVEINLPGINQVNIHPKAGLTFASALRAFLRQDPDIIMVGEIRDLETAEIGIKAAQTGHMVLSTLHTNSAPETLTRLANMGVAPFNIASTVTLIIAQRLARRLCPHCRREEEVPPEALLAEGFTETELQDITIFGPVGCDRCTAGYKGRVGLYEVMPVTDEIGRLIMEGGNSMEIADLARQQGMVDLRRAGLNKVRDGLTSLEEINRVTKD